jgi:hypothetical protein
LSSSGPVPARRPRTQFEHYVPQVYLRPFVAEEQGRNSIYRFNKTSGETELRNIDGVAGARNFYEIEGVHALGSTEQYLGRLESTFAPVRDKILEAKEVVGLTEDERRVVSYFVATQFVRTQEIRAGVRDLIAAVIDSVAGDKLSAELRKEIEESQIESNIRDIHLSLLDSVPWIAGMLMERKWIAVANETEMPFWTSDHPVNLRNEIEPAGIARHGIGLPETQVFLPLSPTLSLLICDYRYYMFEPDQLVARDMNNVVFQNDWQLRQATEFIFSNKEDFSLARRIIEDMPEIANPSRRRVAHFRLGDGEFRAWRPG